MQLIHGDCLEELKTLSDGSVDLVVADLPYGTTSCKWDVLIPFEPLWKELYRVCKLNAAMVFTASQPFTTLLISSNLKDFKYELIWKKSAPSNIALAKIQPLKYHENICVFYRKLPTFNKQMVERDEKGKSRILAGQKNNISFKTTKTEHQPSRECFETDPYKYDANFKNPSSVIEVRNERGGLHSTQKPVKLMDYIIATYSNDGDVVLDPTMGSGTTGVSCLKLNRNFIGIEKDLIFYNIAKQRIDHGV